MCPTILEDIVFLPRDFGAMDFSSYVVATQVIESLTVLNCFDQNGHFAQIGQID
jgi:hypothetical protein